MLKIAHVINVTEITESNKKSYLHVAQPVTLKSMVVAKKMAEGLVDVELWAVKHKRERVNIPGEFRWSKEIDKYAYEHIGPLKNVPKPLPRMKDIILSLYDSSDANYFVYSNLDIGLYPNFYIKINSLISRGYDALCINRRDLPKSYEGIVLNEDKLELAFLADGNKHPGIDCFVFRKEIVPSLNLGNVYLGFPPVGQVLRAQIELQSNNFLWVKDEQYTFHLGSDLQWTKAKGVYAAENWKQADGLYQAALAKNSIVAKIKRKIKSWVTSFVSSQ